MRQQPRVREGVVEAGASHGAQDRQAPGAAGHRREDGQLQVRFVLGRGGELERDPGRADLGEPGLPERVAVAHHELGHEARPVRLPRPAVRRDDEVRVGGPAGPGGIERRARRHVAVADEDRVQGAAGNAAGRPTVDWESERLRSVGGTEALHWTPFAGMTRIRFRGSAVCPHSQRHEALPCPNLRLRRAPTGATQSTPGPRSVPPSRFARSTLSPGGPRPTSATEPDDLARAGVAQLGIRREVRADPDAAGAGGHRHPHVVERIADIGGLRGAVGKAQQLQGVPEAAGTRLLLERVVAVDASGQEPGESVALELGLDARRAGRP